MRHHRVSVDRIGGWIITYRHPCSEEKRASVSEEQLVVVDARADAAGRVMAQHGASEEDLLLPVHDIAHHLP